MQSLLSMILLVTSVSSLQTNLLKHWDLRSGSRCLNGGTLMFRHHHPQRGFCVCPEGFSGTKCEMGQKQQCFSGDGRDYQGTVAQSKSGQRCLGWDLVKTKHRLRPVVRNRWHNYCRNPDGSAGPWCWVRPGWRVTREFCDIPHCDGEMRPESCGERPQKMHKVVGGKITTVESHPWMASIFQKVRSSHKMRFLCGGTLIAPCWVLTAAHCFSDGSATSIRRLSVTLGKNALNETNHKREQTFSIDKLIVHEDFNNSDENYNNDIALLKIRSSEGKCAERSDSVHMACLPPEQHMLPAGVYCDVVGYGKESKRLWYLSQYLREAKVKLLSQKVCTDKDYYGSRVTENMFCAGSPDWNKDACEGDSGGPLVCEVDGRMFLFGIVSWGEDCAREFRPGVYTRVTNYNRWIESKTGLSSITAGSMYPEK
ncbi:hypothetical protein GJAV_G00241980 [Gymnothorax javanicus]|nr:hypothetical protein GJAV_G00241980 [Gymnothorax javanicus]